MAHTPGSWQTLPVLSDKLIIIAQGPDTRSSYPFYIARVYDNIVGFSRQMLKTMLI